ncbi:hypothetical protein Dimus_014860 [Dionaea muscipula]
MKKIKLRKNNGSSESYKFDEVFPKTASQKRVYQVVAEPVVEGSKLHRRSSHLPSIGCFAVVISSAPVENLEASSLPSNTETALLQGRRAARIPKLPIVLLPNFEVYTVCLEGVNELSKKVDETISYVLANRTASPKKVDETLTHDPLSRSFLLDPQISQTKGRKKGKEKSHGSGRFKSGIERATEKNLRLCRCCNKMVRHDKRNCPENPNNRNKRKDEEDDNNDMEEDIDLSD